MVGWLCGGVDNDKEILKANILKLRGGNLMRVVSYE